MFLQLLKIFLKNKKIILYKKTKYNEFIQNELLYHIFSYFLSNTFFLNLEMLIKYISFYKKNIFFLFQEFKQTSTFININQLSKKKYILKNFSKSFFFHSQYMLISKIKNLIIRKINPILSTCIQFEYLFKKKAKLNSFFLNKTFLCNFCIYNRTGNAYEFKKTYSIIKKIQNYTCYSTLNLIKKRCKTAVDRFLITLFQLRINLENEWYFRIYCAINHTSFQNLFENFSKKNLVYKKFFHFEDFLILSEIRTQKKKNAVYINFKLNKIHAYLRTSGNKCHINMEQLFNALISLCLCKKLKLGYLIWKVQKNNKKNQVLFTLKKIFKKEIKYKIRKKLMFKKYIIVKNFKQDHIDNRHQIYSFFCLKIFMNKFLNKIFREIGQISNIIQQSYSKQKKLKNVLLFLKKINLIEKTKIDHKNIKKFNSKSFDAIYIQKSNMPAKFIGNENYKNNANIKCISNYALNLFKFLFQKTNQLKKKNISPNFKKTTQLKILKFKLLYLFIFMFKTKKFYSTLIRKVVEYDIILTISMFLRKKNLSNNKLHVKYAKKKINFQMHKFFFSKKNLCIFYRTKISIPCKFCLIYTKKRYFFNVVVIEIFLKNLFRSYKLRSKIIPEYLKDFFQLKFNHIFVLKDPSYRKIKKTFVNKIFRSNLKFKAYFQSN